MEHRPQGHLQGWLPRTTCGGNQARVRPVSGHTVSSCGRLLCRDHWNGANSWAAWTSDVRPSCILPVSWGSVLHSLSFKHAGKINDLSQVSDFSWDGTEGRMGWGSRRHLGAQRLSPVKCTCDQEARWGFKICVSNSRIWLSPLYRGQCNDMGYQGFIF